MNELTQAPSGYNGDVMGWAYNAATSTANDILPVWKPLLMKVHNGEHVTWEEYKELETLYKYHQLLYTYSAIQEHTS